MTHDRADKLIGGYRLRYRRGEISRVFFLDMKSFIENEVNRLPLEKTKMYQRERREIENYFSLCRRSLRKDGLVMIHIEGKRYEKEALFRNLTLRMVLRRIKKEDKVIMDEIVEVTCYRETTRMTRKEAITKFQEGVMCCEGSERDRYMNILMGLLAGEKRVCDISSE